GSSCYDKFDDPRWQDQGRGISFSNRILCQKLGKEAIHHPTLRVHRSCPVAKFTPSLALNREKVLFLFARSLVQQRNALSPVGELVELVEIPFPCRQVAEGVDGVNGQDVSILRVRQNGAGVLGNMVGDQWAIAAESVLLVMLVGKFAILAI